MLEIQVSTRVLAAARFSRSPLAELAGSLHVLATAARRRGGPGAHGRWAMTARARTANLDLELLVGLCPAGRFAPDFMFAPGDGPTPSIEDQLHSLSLTPVHVVRAGLDRVWSAYGGPPAALGRLLDSGRPGVDRLVEHLHAYWRAAVEPYWSRMCAVIAEDLAHRGTQLVSDGMKGLLSHLHADVSFAGDVLFVDQPHHPDDRVACRVLTFIPSVFTVPHVVFDNLAQELTVTYGAVGASRTWDDHWSGPASDRLGALLGRTRATVLRRLAIPSSTTELARVLRQSPASISEHLSVLRDTGLVQSYRSGRHVLYQRTMLGSSMAASGDLSTRPRLASR